MSAFPPSCIMLTSHVQLVVKSFAAFRAGDGNAKIAQDVVLYALEALLFAMPSSLKHADAKVSVPMCPSPPPAPRGRRVCPLCLCTCSELSAYLYVLTSLSAVCLIASRAQVVKAMLSAVERHMTSSAVCKIGLSVFQTIYDQHADAEQVHAPTPLIMDADDLF